MTSVGRRPTLYELLEALHAVCRVEADADAIDPKSETFRVVLTFQRAQCPQDWQDGAPKPTWLFEQIMDELHAWMRQRDREEQWVSKEDKLGSSIDTLMAHYHEELKKTSAGVQNMVTRMQTRVVADTIMRLKELKERREAGGVYSPTENRRDKARKAWMEDEYEAPKREQEQRRQQESRDNANAESFFRAWQAFKGGGKEWEDIFTGTFTGTGGFTGQQRKDPHKAQPGNKRSWYAILGVSAHASKKEITKAYRKLASQYHPDRYKESDGHAKMAEINTARDEGLGGV